MSNMESRLNKSDAGVVREKNVLVIGAGSGIGAALVDRLASRIEVNHVVALSARPVAAIGRDVTWLAHDALKEAPAALTGKLKSHVERLHQVFVCVGFLHDSHNRPEKALRELSCDHAMKSFRSNALAPLRYVEGCLPLLFHAERSEVLILSAKVGSIGDNGLGGWYSYRMSKAALNMGVRNLAIEAGRRRNHPIVAAVHPGTTRSPLSNAFLRGRECVSARKAADRLVALANGCDPSIHGCFVHWDGTPLPW